ncbi:IucA/IucC family protein [Paenibacillus planticolens]|uniref:IucA/IucC family protein n=1 Tax=Paenibacillus planticolens TaxID=2654976 RepID=A0ABX1ZXS2_9BACL|nr:IucA/IucC family protein [Paenibacillus planticolens]NOV04658.1 IucA/IucC family protein [Paenibacillus planticolens]
MPNKLTRDRAEQRVMEDLVNALLAEQFLDDHASVERLSKGEWDAIITQDAQMKAVQEQFGAGADLATHVYRWHLEDAVIVFPVRASIAQPYWFEISYGLCKASLHAGKAALLSKPSPLELMGHVVMLYMNDPVAVDPYGAVKFLHMIEQTLLQTSFSLENEQPAAHILGLPQRASLLAAERKAGYRDRPFHPVSKVKQGWAYDECSSYTAEFGRRIKLNWMAVKQDYVVSGLEEGKELFPVDLLLSDEERSQISNELNRRGLGEGAYTAIPVHPWQMSAILPEQIKRELEEGICIPLETETGTFYATSSVRSLMPENESPYHVKLPLGIYSLGGLRYLSAIKLMNGQQAEWLMRQAVERDAVLKTKLFLCDETKWWAYLPEDRDLFADYPRHLSALVREYPAELVQDADIRLLPMSALSVYASAENGHVLDEWLKLMGSDRSEPAAVVRLFHEVLVSYFEICFRLFRLGMMPEVHGQNCVLVWKHGKIEGLLLRDHDALRVHVPWLKANGLEDPAYTLRAGYPNSLYHEHPQKLLSFFQMLGIQVNIYAILRSVSQYYGLSEESLWEELQTCLEEAIQKAELPDEVANVLQEALFVKAVWPWKQVVRPLLKKQTMRVPGSMPYGQGEVANPFHILNDFKNRRDRLCFVFNQEYKV